MTTISVITPFYNAQEFILDCALSVQKSITFNQFELEHIFVDDGSTDHSVERMTPQLSESTLLISLEKNAGPSNARNEGLKRATGRYIFFLDADDIIFENSLRYLFEKAQTEQVAWIYGDFLRGNEQLQYMVGQDYYGWNFSTAADTLYSMYTGKHFFQQNNFFSQSILNEVHGFTGEITMAEDFDLCTRLLLNGHMPNYMAGPLYLHRVHAKNVSTPHLTQPDLHRQQIAQLYKRYKKSLNKILSIEQTVEVERYLMDIKV